MTTTETTKTAACCESCGESFPLRDLIEVYRHDADRSYCGNCYDGPCIDCGLRLETAYFDRGEREVEPCGGRCGLCHDELGREIAGEAAAELRAERWS